MREHHQAPPHRADKDVTVIRFPNSNHPLFEARRGGYDEYGALERFVPDMHRIILDWLNEKARIDA